MSTKLTFARAANGGFDLDDPRLEALVAALFDGNPEPRIPASLMSAVRKKLVSETRRIESSHKLDFAKAGSVMVDEKGPLYKLSTGRAVPDSDGSADVVIA